MWWTAIFDVLADLGTATIDPLWLPILAWTVLTLPLLVLLNRTDRLHPHAAYRLSQMLLAALPASLLVAAVGDWGAGVRALPTVGSLPPLLLGSDLGALGVESASSPAPSWHWGHTMGLATAGTGLVALGALVRLGLDAWAAIRVRMTAEHQPALHSTARSLARTLGLRRRPRISTHPDTAVPLTIPGRPPVILLPAPIAGRDETLRMVLAHEFVHLRRYDDVALLLERTVAALFAAHPLVWALRRSINRFRERACDAAVLQGGHVPSGGYARLLTHFATGTAPYAGALSLSDSSSLIDRLRAMRSLPSLSSLSPTTLTAGVVTAGVVLVLGVAACSDSLTNPAAEENATVSSPARTQEAADEVYVVVEDQPKLKGGMAALRREVTYPDMARKAGIEGRVFVQFVVGKDGSVQDPTITRGEHKLLNEEALRAVKQMEFEPGRQRGEPVRVKMSLPVTFRLPDSATTESDASMTPEASSAMNSQVGERVQNAMRNVEYPALLRKAGVEGRVIVALTVGPSGRIKNPRVIESAHDALDAAALRAVRDLQFEATGQPTDITLPMTFSHSEADGAQIRFEVRAS